MHEHEQQIHDIVFQEEDLVYRKRAYESSGRKQKEEEKIPQKGFRR